MTNHVHTTLWKMLITRPRICKDKKSTQITVVPTDQITEICGHEHTETTAIDKNQKPTRDCNPFDKFKTDKSGFDCGEHYYTNFEYNLLKFGHAVRKPVEFAAWKRSTVHKKDLYDFMIFFSTQKFDNDCISSPNQWARWVVEPDNCGWTSVLRERAPAQRGPTYKSIKICH